MHLKNLTLTDCLIKAVLVKERVFMSDSGTKQVLKTNTKALKPNAVLVLDSGEVFYGIGTGAKGEAVAELCFNTAMTGYQEILTDPSYCEQIILFTFPHIGNVGTNNFDEEAASPKAKSAARGIVMRETITKASNYRSEQNLDEWLEKRGIIGISGVDTRALTARIRQDGMPHAVIAHNETGRFDINALVKKAQNWPGIKGADLAQPISTDKNYEWNEAGWNPSANKYEKTNGSKHVVLIDYGTKRNILRCLAENNLKITVVSANMSADDILALAPDGVVLSNGPGDPQATGKTAIKVIKELISHEIPIFGICLGHQILALALGAKTVKMDQGHHGANHPVMDFETNKVEIVSMNHGFAVDKDSLPQNVVETHKSLFDGSNCGIRLKDKPVFSVQHHPEASPGPKDSFYLFERFAEYL